MKNTIFMILRIMGVKNLVEALKEKLELLKSRYDKEILLDLALLNASVGNSDVAKLYIDEYKKQCSSTDIKVSYDTFNSLSTKSKSAGFLYINIEYY